jgi:hypothetical protein
MLKQSEAVLAGYMLPVFGDKKLSYAELEPSRMHEYVMAEEAFVQILSSLFTLLLVSTLLQGAIWLIRLRRASAVPILLMPPGKVVLRTFLLGILLPMGVYLIYSRLPVLSGRDMSLLGGGMYRRMALEMIALGAAMLWVPVRTIRRYIRRRCAELGVDIPETRDELVTNTKIWLSVLGLLCLAAFSFTILMPISMFISTVGIATSMVVAGYVVFYFGRRQGRYGLYYGTLARSMAPMYAITVMLLSLTVQPYLMYNEASLLAKDPVMFGQLRHTEDEVVGCSGVEVKAANTYTRLLDEAVNGKK